jgi:hypothetical protein
MKNFERETRDSGLRNGETECFIARDGRNKKCSEDNLEGLWRGGGMGIRKYRSRFEMWLKGRRSGTAGVKPPFFRYHCPVPSSQQQQYYNIAN